MVKHPLQNLETSLAPQPSGSKNVRRTQGYVLFRKHSLMSHTNTQRMESLRPACTWMSHLFWVTPGSQPRNAVIWCTTKLSRANANPCTISHLHCEHLNWPNSKNNCLSRQAGKAATLNPKREEISPLYVYYKFHPHSSEDTLTQTFSKHQDSSVMFTLKVQFQEVVSVV